MRTRFIARTLASASVALAACGSDNPSTPAVSKIVNFTAVLTPAGEVGATLKGSPAGSGTLTASLDTSTNVFTWDVEFAGLTSNVNNGHIHGPFPLGTATSAGVILNFNPTAIPNATSATFTGLNSATSGSAKGSIVLNAAALSGTVGADSLVKLLLSGEAYVNIHTVQNPGGEIRGQITKN